MAIKRYAGDRFTGLSIDIKPMNISDGAVFYELDTGLIYNKFNNIWTVTSGGTGGGISGYSGYSGFPAISYVSDTTPPPPPLTGEIWLDTDEPSFMNYLKVRVVTFGPDVVHGDDELLLCYNTFNILLPVATGRGRVITIKNQGLGVITIIPDPSNPDTIDDIGSRVIISGECVGICDGNSNAWFSIASPGLVTTVGSPGSDSSIPSEQAVREALSEKVQLLGTSGGQTIIGGTGHNDKLTLQANSHIGNTSNAPAIDFKYGDAGALTAATILQNGRIGVGIEVPLSLFHIKGFTPILTLEHVSVSPVVDENVWFAHAGATTLKFRASDDTLTNSNSFLEVVRSGYTITSSTFPNGTIGIGSASANSILQIDSSLAPITGNASAFNITATLDPATAGNLYGISVALTSGTNAVTTARGLNIPTITKPVGAGTITTIQAVYIATQTAVCSGATGVTSYVPSGGAVYNYGIRIPGTGSVIPANNWALYSDSTCQSYMAGSLGIGISAPTAALDVVGSMVVSGTANAFGTASPNAILQMNSSFTPVSGNAQGFTMSPILIPEAAGSAFGLSVSMTVGTAGVTIGTARSITIGKIIKAASAITNLSGLYVAAQDAEATSSHGIYTNVGSYGTVSNVGLRIASGTPGITTWALYSDSTCQSYMAGSLGIGISAPTAALDVRSPNVAKSIISSRYSGTGTKISLDVGNVSGIPYIGWNTTPKVSSDTVTYDLALGAAQLGWNTAGDLIYQNAVVGVAGADVTFSERFRVLNTGNVGIGSLATNPSELLELKDSNPRIYLGDATAPVITTNRLYSVAGNLYWNGNLIESNLYYVSTAAIDHCDPSILGSLANILSGVGGDSATVAFRGDFTYSLNWGKCYVQNNAISFDTNTITAAALNFTTLGFVSGMSVQIFGSHSNDGFYHLNTVGIPNISNMTTIEPLIAEATGHLITILFCIPSNITLQFNHGAILLPYNRTGAGIPDLYINGPIKVDYTQRIFDISQSGEVWFRCVNPVYPNWWGAVADDTTDTGVYHNAAMNSIDEGTVVLPKIDGIYHYSTGMICKSNIKHEIKSNIRSIPTNTITDWWMETTVDVPAFADTRTNHSLFLVGNGRLGEVVSNVEICGGAYIDGGSTDLVKQAGSAVTMRRCVENIKIHDLHISNYNNEIIVYGDEDRNPLLAYCNNIEIYNIRADGLCGPPENGSGINFFPRAQIYNTKAIEGLSRMSECVVTVTAHGLETDNIVVFTGILSAEWKTLNDNYGLATGAEWIAAYTAAGYNTEGHPTYTSTYINRSNAYVITKLSDNTFSIPVDTSGFANPYNYMDDPGVLKSGHKPVSTNVRIHDCYFDVTNGLNSVAGSGDPGSPTHGPQSIKINNVDGMVINNIQIVGGDIDGITISTSARNINLSDINITKANRGIIIAHNIHSSGSGVGKVGNININNLSYDCLDMEDCDEWVIELQNDPQNVNINNVTGKGSIVLNITGALPFPIPHPDDLDPDNPDPDEPTYHYYPLGRIGKMHGLNINNVSLVEGLICHYRLNYTRFVDSNPLRPDMAAEIVAPNITNIQLKGGLGTGVGKILMDAWDNNGDTPVRPPDPPNPNLLRRTVTGGTFKNIKLFRSDGYPFLNYGDDNTIEDIYGYDCYPSGILSSMALVLDEGNRTRISNLKVGGSENNLHYFVRKTAGEGGSIKELTGTIGTPGTGIYISGLTYPVSGDIVVSSKSLNLSSYDLDLFFLASDCDYYISFVTVFYNWGVTSVACHFRLGNNIDPSAYMTPALEIGKVAGYYKNYINHADLSYRLLSRGQSLVASILSPFDPLGATVKVSVGLIRHLSVPV